MKPITRTLHDMRPAVFRASGAGGGRIAGRRAGSRLRPYLLVALAGSLGLPAAASAQTVQDLQRQIDELKATIAELKAANAPVASRASASSASPSPPAPIAPAQTQVAAPTPPSIPPAPQPVPTTQLAEAQPKPERAWYDRIALRGYTQMRFNEILSGDRTAPDGRSRLRSVHDGAIGDNNNFSLRRVRLVLQGDLNDRVSFYFQPDFAVNVNNQSVGERRESFAQLRDAYVDAFLDTDRRFRLRFGQSKVPFGWENMQSSSNRLTLDRSDGINSAVPGERDLGVVAYYTPPQVQRIWDRLEEDGQKLFGNYGAFGLGVYNGQGISRAETNDGVMTVAMATWPFALDGLGDAFAGQVIETGAAAIRNRIQPELRSGGVSAASFADERFGVHAILYPQPIGFQAEWNWGRGPEYDPVTQSIATKRLNGGYFQTMGRVRTSPLGPFMPYARWQYYRGGWKALPNAPRLETDEFELGIEFQPTPPLELTIAYARMERREADERREGRAEGNLIRTQLQWNY
ncbi:porin [Sphingomonas faeni]|uniref:porin n=1 Tax=Sphingomonas faeni TaxID=185950 RepID=UPI0020C04C9E|nr:porin [Sphingomonas faeni]MCK8456417.1 OprO/OprP family phosphate-selective porin [Sphingomonas faeni]